MRPRRALAAWLLLAICAAPAIACEARFAPEGLPGRAASITFDNPRADRSRENWVPPGTRLEFHAAFGEATDEYGHSVLGSLRDAKLLTIHLRRPGASRITCPAEVLLPAGQVFEDIAPRLADLDGDGMPEVIVVQSDTAKGASLAVYDRRARLLAATPPIGQPFRWLAPLGAADLDGDGHAEIAYVDRPHLARTLRVWRYRDGRLAEVASAPGHTSHRIGDETISGGIRACSGRPPEIVTLDPAWSRILRTTLRDGTLSTTDLGRYNGPESLAKALTCS